MHLPEIERFLAGRANLERQYGTTPDSGFLGLERMKELCQRLGHPEQELRAVHIAGTKGKGSTSTMLAAICQAAGLRVGLYTSPHLTHFRERIVIDGRPIEVADFHQAVSRLMPIVGEIDAKYAGAGPTYFELLTAVALEHFLASQVEIAILEVGLGGRLDATNVCHPDCCIITNISRDHTQHLGNTLASIAKEKSGIIKAHVPVITAAESRSARLVIESIADAHQSVLYRLHRDFHVRSHSLELTSPGSKTWPCDYQSGSELGSLSLKQLEIRMLGRHQHLNAGLAISAAEVLRQRGWQISDEAIREGLRTAQARARLEVLEEGPVLVLDTAHNRASMAATVDGLRAYWPGRRTIVVLATTTGKDVAGMLRSLLPFASCLVLTQYETNSRANPISQVTKIAARLCKRHDGYARCQILEATRPQAALELARQLAGPDDVICITGSFFLAAELLPYTRPSRHSHGLSEKMPDY